MGLGKLLVFIDQTYWKEGDTITTDENFLLFVQAFAPAFDRIHFLGRLHPEPGRAPYHCAPHPDFDFTELPYYPSALAPHHLLVSFVRGVRTTWAAVGASDAVLLGVPNPWSLLLWVISRLRRRPVILLVRQNLAARVRLRLSGLKGTFAVAAVNAIERAFMRIARTTLTFTVGEDMRRRYARPGAPVYSVLTSLLDGEALARTPRALPPPGEPRRLVWVGRFHPDKGLDVLLDAFQEVSRQIPEPLQLDLVGNGPDEDSLRARVATLGLDSRVNFYGYVPFGSRLQALYREATAFILSSRSEGFPKVITEAMAAALPVVCTAVGSIPLMLEHQRNAFLVPPGDARALADGIRQVLTDPGLYARLSASGLERARQHTLEAQRDKMLERIVPYLAARRKRA